MRLTEFLLDDIDENKEAIAQMLSSQLRKQVLPTHIHAVEPVLLSKRFYQLGANDTDFADYERSGNGFMYIGHLTVSHSGLNDVYLKIGDQRIFEFKNITTSFPCAFNGIDLPEADSFSMYFEGFLVHFEDKVTPQALEVNQPDAPPAQVS